MNWKFTTVLHTVRKSLGLTVVEYCMLDLIYQVQTYPANAGKCEKSYAELSEVLGISKSGAAEICKRLEERGFLEKKGEQKKVLEKFYMNAYGNHAEDANNADRHKAGNRTMTVMEMAGYTSLPEAKKKLLIEWLEYLRAKGKRLDTLIEAETLLQKFTFNDLETLRKSIETCKKQGWRTLVFDKKKGHEKGDDFTKYY